METSTAKIDARKLTSNLSQDQKKLLLLKQFQRSQNSTIGNYQIGNVKTWEDFTRSSGFTVDPSLVTLPVNGVNIKQAFAIKRAKVEAGEELLETPVKDTPLKDKIEEKPKHEWEIEDEYSVIPALRSNPLIRYDDVTKFQEEDAAMIVRRLVRDKRKAVALDRGVGLGKTFILGGTIAELYRRQWPPLVNSLSTYPVCYVTAASVVEQTARVLRNKFSLKIGHQIFVTNVDQLRSSFGKELLQEKLVHIHGQETLIYQWFEPLAPALMILDESHKLKNVDSQQSRIMQAFNDMPITSEHYQIFSSATLWTRVEEAKCFAVGTRLEF